MVLAVKGRGPLQTEPIYHQRGLGSHGPLAMDWGDLYAVLCCVLGVFCRARDIAQLEDLNLYLLTI